MPRLTLRTLLAYIDDTLEPDQARTLGRKVAESPEAKQLIERIKKVTRRRGLHIPTPDGSHGDVSDPNTVAEYLSDSLGSEQTKELEATALSSDVHLAEIAACHQILTLVLTEPVRVPPSAHQRMYKLVEPPAGDPDRKPGKFVPVGRISPPSATPPEADDRDAAWLLGMKRYSATEPWAGRLGFLGAVAGVALFLAFASWMALPRKQPEPPETTPANQFAFNHQPAPTPVVPEAPEPHGNSKQGDSKPIEPKKDPVEPEKNDPVDDGMKKPVEPKKNTGLGDPVQAPLSGRGTLGRIEKMDSSSAIVLTRSAEPGAPWLRVDPENNLIQAGEAVMALPGYKADVKLDSGVVVDLWGNVPEQVAMKSMVMQSQVRLHPPASGFDADLTLLTGRVYLSTTRKTGAKIRVRLAGETWDVVLPNDLSEVMVQAHSAFVPGAPFAREGGESPRTEARFAVVRGTADFNAPARFKKFEKIPAWNEITWDSKSGLLSDPKALTKDDPATAKIVLLEGEQGKQIQRALSDAASKLTDRSAIRVMLEGRMNYADTLANYFPIKFAIYSYAAIADGPEIANLVANLYDRLAERDRNYARQAAVMAVSGWLPRNPENTKTFCEVMTGKKLLPDEEADLIAHLLRGFSSSATGDASAVDKLCDFLDHPNVIVRESALGNLIAFFDPDAARKIELGGLNVAARGEPGYEKALKSWRSWAEEMKRKMTDKKMTEKK